MYKTTRGLILREVRYKEADKILTILTEDEGKITAKARGALRPKSKVAAATQLLTFSDITLFGHKGMWTVNEAAPLEQFLGLRGDIALLALGTYIAELLEAVSDQDYPDPAILHLGLNSLYALSEGLYEKEQVRAGFELRLMSLSGYRPELSSCAECGAADEDGLSFSPENGQVFCGSCTKYGMKKLSRAVLSAMRHIVDASPQRVLSFKLDAASLEQLSELCEAYTLCQTDRPFRSLSYYKKLIR